MTRVVDKYEVQQSDFNKIITKLFKENNWTDAFIKHDKNQFFIRLINHKPNLKTKDHRHA